METEIDSFENGSDRQESIPSRLEYELHFDWYDKKVGNGGFVVLDNEVGESKNAGCSTPIEQPWWEVSGR